MNVMQVADTLATRCGFRPLSGWKYTWRYRAEKVRIGVKYALGMELTRTEGDELLYDAGRAAGRAILASIDVEGTLDTALDRYENHPLLEHYIAEGVEHVRRKWSGNGDMVGDAEDWAIEKAVEYAARDGVTFRETDDWSGQG